MRHPTRRLHLSGLTLTIILIVASYNHFLEQSPQIIAPALVSCLSDHLHLLRGTAPLRAFFYPPHHDRAAIVSCSYGDPITPYLLVAEAEDVMIYDTLRFLSCDSPQLAELFVFDIPLSARYKMSHYIVTLNDSYIEYTLGNDTINSPINYFTRYHGVDHAMLCDTYMHGSHLREYNFLRRTEIFTVSCYFAFERTPYPRFAWHLPQITICSNHPYPKLSNIFRRNASDPCLVFLGSQFVFFKRGTRIRTGMMNYLRNISHPLFNIRDFIRINDSGDPNYHSGWAASTGLYTRFPFGLCPEGDDPVSKRFDDMIRACCIPIVVSDDLTTSYESLFYDPAKIWVNVPMYKPQLIGRAINLLHNRKEEEMRFCISEMRRFLGCSIMRKYEVKTKEWCWFWQNYFITIIKLGSQRWGLLPTLPHIHRTNDEDNGTYEWVTMLSPHDFSDVR